MALHPAYKHHFVIRNQQVFDEPVLNHQTGSKFYETNIRPDEIPASRKMELR